LGRAPDEAVVDGVLDDVLDRGVVLLLGLDHLRPESPAEYVIAAAVALVEGARVTAVQVAHTVREVRSRGLHDQVVVIAHQAADVEAPAVPPNDPVQDVDEDDAVRIVPDDRRLVVAPRGDVVERAGGEVAVWATHLPRR
jgi:hypothetical protein